MTIRVHNRTIHKHNTTIHKHNNKDTQFTQSNRSTQNTQPYIQRYKWTQNNVKEYDKPNRHVSSKLHVFCISADNDRHPVTKTCTPLHYTSPNHTSLHFTCTC